MSSPEPTGMAAAAIEQAKRYRDAADKIRLRADTAAKLLAALGTTAVGAVSLAKFSDVFPLPGGAWSVVLAVVTVAGFAAMGVAVALFTRRLWRSSRPLFMPSDTAKLEDLDDEERELVDRIYRQIASLNGTPSLYAYEARAWRLQAIAGRVEDPLRATLLAEADTIMAEVNATQSKAIVTLARRRTSSVTSGSAWAVVALFVAGLVALGIGSDYLASERTDRVATAKACAEAREAKAVGLPQICGTPPAPSSTPTRPPDPSAEAAQALAALATQYQECVSKPGANCAPLVALIRSAVLTQPG